MSDGGPPLKSKVCVELNEEEEQEEREEKRRTDGRSADDNLMEHS